MNLYHGTAVAFLSSIEKKGLLPRGHKKLGNWGFEGQAKAHSQCVYMTPQAEQHADFYALRAAVVNNSIECVKLTIDYSKLDEDKFLPDENLFVIGDSNGQVFQKEMSACKQKMKRERHRWRESLERRSLVCYEGQIPREAIVDIKTYPRHENFHYNLLCSEVGDRAEFDAKFSAWTRIFTWNKDLLIGDNPEVDSRDLRIIFTDKEHTTVTIQGHNAWKLRMSPTLHTSFFENTRYPTKPQPQDESTKVQSEIYAQ